VPRCQVMLCCTVGAVTDEPTIGEKGLP